MSNDNVILVLLVGICMRCSGRTTTQKQEKTDTKHETQVITAIGNNTPCAIARSKAQIQGMIRILCLGKWMQSYQN